MPAPRADTETPPPDDTETPRVRLNAWRRRWSASRRSFSREETWLGWWLVLPAVILILALVVYPVVVGFGTSLHAEAPTLTSPSRLVGLRNYSGEISDPATRSAVVHTVFYVAICLALEIVGGLAAAVALQRSFRGRGMALAVLILPWALPSVVSGVLWQRILAPDNGLLNSVLLQLHIIHTPVVWMASGWAIPLITVVHVWGVLPLIVLILIAGLQSIPDEVYNASAVDGASQWRQFWHITLPLLRPVLAVAMTIGLVDAITIFDEIYVLNGTGLNTASVVVQIYNTVFVDAEFAHGIALAFLVAVATALCAVVAIVTSRRATV